MSAIHDQALAPAVVMLTPGGIEPMFRADIEGGLDPFFADQYGLFQARFPEAWAASSGEGVILAIIDSGVNLSVEDLVGVDVRQPLDPRLDGTSGDACGHGTLTAGVALAGRYNDVGIAGAAPRVILLPERALDGDCEGTTTLLARAIIDATLSGARVISMSLTAGDPGEVVTTELAIALEFAKARDVLLIAAAGNDGFGPLPPPANYPGVVSVGCVDANLTLCPFSPAAATVFGAGSRILTTDADGGYIFATGTSLSTPFVASAAALARAAFPNATSSEITAALAPADPAHALNVLDAFRTLEALQD